MSLLDLITIVAYAKDLQESTTPLEYLMYKGKYEKQKLPR